MARRRRKSLPKTPVHAHIEGLSHDNAGIARIEGKTTFIQGALPGEEVEFVYTQQKSQYDKGDCVSVVNPSPERVTPECDHYGYCGGCSLQHLGIENQIKTKQAVLLDLLTHATGALPSHVLTPLVRQAWAYRHKARLSVRYVEKKQKVLVGFRERLSGRFIADIDSCAVLAPEVGTKLTELKDLVSALSNYKDIAQIEVAVAENQTALILRHLSELSEEDKTTLRNFAIEHQVSWYLQPGGMDTVHPMDENTERLSYSLPDYNLTYLFKPTDFTQVNPFINEPMVKQALELLALESTDKVLDLFCGLGNFTLPIALKAQQVVGVEGSEEMVQRAGENAAHNGLDNTSFYACDLFGENLAAEPWVSQDYDKLLIDPPRTGALALCNQIERFNPSRLVYVSCSPQTLARDAKVLVEEKGYTLQAAGVMDMFPHTAHVESIALFTKK